MVQASKDGRVQAGAQNEHHCAGAPGAAPGGAGQVRAGQDGQGPRAGLQARVRPLCHTHWRAGGHRGAHGAAHAHDCGTASSHPEAGLFPEISSSLAAHASCPVWSTPAPITHAVNAGGGEGPGPGASAHRALQGGPAPLRQHRVRQHLLRPDLHGDGGRTGAPAGACAALWALRLRRCHAGWHQEGRPPVANRLRHGVRPMRSGPNVLARGADRGRAQVQVQLCGALSCCGPCLCGSAGLTGALRRCGWP